MEALCLENGTDLFALGSVGSEISNGLLSLLKDRLHYSPKSSLLHTVLYIISVCWSRQLVFMGNLYARFANTSLKSTVNYCAYTSQVCFSCSSTQLLHTQEIRKDACLFAVSFFLSHPECWCPPNE